LEVDARRKEIIEKLRGLSTDTIAKTVAGDSGLEKRNPCAFQRMLMR
jgi:hypothetical protein